MLALLKKLRVDLALDPPGATRGRHRRHRAAKRTRAQPSRRNDATAPPCRLTRRPPPAAGA